LLRLIFYFSCSQFHLDKSFISKFGFLHYLDLNLESFPKELSRSFDEYVGISDTIEDGLDSTKVLALVLVSELVEEYGFSKVSEPELTDVNFYNTLIISLSFNDNQCINLTCLIFV